ncbi:MAG: polysaccharide biosynthesis tyrosine autokinase [Candidatus Omnitrophota bacterium]|nr:polysaccharide biosynthesis tyrosine autokinase [Candidatus Omnitrophota bacterium]
MLPSSQLRDITVKDYLVIVKRRFWIILICLAITTTDATMKTLKKIALYRASARILVEKTMPDIVPIRQVYASPGWVDKEYLQSQISIMTSRSLARKIAENLIATGDDTFKGMPEPEGAFLGGVSVNMVGGTQLIDVGYVSTDPIKAAKFANALAEGYIKDDVERRVEASKYATGWLQIQLTELKKKLQDSETGLNNYIQKNEIISLADVERQTASILEGLKGDKVRIENEIIELSKRYKSKHPKMINLNTKLEAVNKSIDEETRKLLELNTKTIQYNALKREVESDKSLYESLLRRIKETEVSKQLETTNIRIIDLAQVPGGPFSPNRKQDVSKGIMLGFFLGVVLAFILEYLDSTVKTAEDIETYVRLPFLGYVPSARREAKTMEDVDLLSHKMPNSRIAEAYRSIRSSIIFSSPEDKPLKTVLITSASPQEGKSTVTINLGTIFAHANEKVLILEADMRRCRIGSSLGIDSKDGLSSFLAGAATLDIVIKHTPIPNLFLIPAGPRPPNPAELLSSAKSRQLLGELKTRFDRIIIDAPPVLTVTDAAILANMADGVVYVIRAGFRNIEAILSCRQRLNEAKARIIGVILNNVNIKKEDSYYYYHYYYAQEKEKKA